MTTSYSIENYSKKFNDVNQEVRAHWQLGMEAARNVSIKLNELVSIQHKEHPDWSVKKIAHSIWAANEDLDGFSKDTIYRNLNDDNKALLDVNRQNRQKNVLEESVLTREHKVIEESSMIYHSDEDEKSITEIDETVYNVDDIKDWTKKDSTNHNQDFIQIQQSNPIPNYMLPWYERKTPSEKIAKLIDYHLGVIIENCRQLWIEVNRMIRKMYQENPGWSLDKIITTIWAYNEKRGEYIPFDKEEIKKHLDIEYKELFGIFKKDKSIQGMKSIEDMR